MAKNADRVQIVLTMIDETTQPIDGQWTTSRGDGINPVAKLRTVKYAKAMMWLRAGGDSDLAKARQYAADNGYTVHTFPTSEREPLAAAKRAALR